MRGGKFHRRWFFRFRRRWRKRGLRYHKRRWCEEHRIRVRWTTRATRSNSGKVYCSRQCKYDAAHPTKEYNEAKHRRALGLGMGRPCPKPWKIACESEAEVLLRFRDLMAMDPQLAAYECRCGKWHAGHPKGSGYRELYRPPGLGYQIIDTLDPEVRQKLQAMFKGE